MVREALTGEKPPQSLDGAVNLWRPFIEEKAGADIAKLKDALRDQKAFARLTKTMLNIWRWATTANPPRPTRARRKIPANRIGQDEQTPRKGETGEMEETGRTPRGWRGS
jgi:cobaltochelatase CobT